MPDKITLDRIKLMHPKVRAEVEAMYLHANNVLLGKDVRLRFTHTLRTIAEQDALYAQGRTAPGNKVTNAKGGQSYHNYGLAFDIALLYDKDGNGSFETASWEYDANFKRVTAFFKSQGWEWGGDFKTISDKPHFQKTFGYSTAQLKLKMRGTYPAV